MASIFADIKTPYVDLVTLKRLLVPKTKENIFQNIITRPEESATEKFSTDTDAAELQIIRVLPNDGQARAVGADINGNYFNDDEARQPSTAAYGIRILTTIDYNIDIPTNMQDMVNVDMAEAELKNLSGKVARNVNAMTLAAQLAKNFNARAAAGSAFNNWVTVNMTTPTAGMWKDAIISAGTNLDNGNLAQGIETYPEDNRAVFIRPMAKGELMKTGNIIIGGSNYAQDILRNGGLDSDARPDNINGYLGEVNNMPIYMASPAIWSLIEAYLGLSPNALAKVYGVCVSSIGTGRALAFNNVMKTIDAPTGQGIRLQPKYRMGVECWDEFSVVPIVDTTFSNPATAATPLSLLAPGSRPAATISSVTVGGTAVTGVAGVYTASVSTATAAVVITAPAGTTTFITDSVGAVVASPVTLGAVASSTNFYIVATGAGLAATTFKLNIART